MKLLLMRHGDKRDDNSIENNENLSEIGKEKSIKMAFVIKNQLNGKKIGKIDLILYSPAAHAKETADIVAHILGFPKAAKEVKEEPSLSPNKDTNDIKKYIEEKIEEFNEKIVLLIGHDPQITNLISELSGEEVVLDRAGVCCLEIKDIHKGENPAEWTINPYVDDKILQLDYEITNEYFKHLSEIRFKLLAFVPLVSGTAIGLLTLNNEGQSADPAGALILGIFGSLVTLGVMIYELRNSQFYDLAVGRAKKLEWLLKMPLGGLFNGRPRPEDSPKIIGRIKVWHDLGLALIYGTTLSGWCYLISYSSLQISQIIKSNGYIFLASGIVAFAVLLISVLMFLLLERDRKRLGQGEGY
jgi:phosphohistidine phosphatase SixA